MAADLLQLKQIEEDEILYHYTKSAGVQGILENNSFWATKSDFLNDPKECSYFMTKIKTICRELFSEFEQQDFLLESLFGAEEKKPKEKALSHRLFMLWLGERGNLSVGFLNYFDLQKGILPLLFFWGAKSRRMISS